MGFHDLQGANPDDLLIDSELDKNSIFEHEETGGAEQPDADGEFIPFQ